jgi:hypothetical protein
MTKNKSLIALSLCLILAVAAALIFRPRSPQGAEPGDPAGDPLKDLPKTYADLSSLGFRAVRLVVSASLGAETDPCGCAPGRPGGLARRATAYDRLRKRSDELPTVFIDGGDSLYPEFSRRVAALMPVYRAKAELIWNTLQNLGVRATGFGSNDLVVDSKTPQFLTKERQTALLLTNLRHPEMIDAPERVHVARPYPDLAVAVVSLFDDAALKTRGLDQLGFRAENPVESIRKFAGVLDKPPLVILISHVSARETVQDVVAACDAIRIIIDSGRLIQNPRGGRAVMGKALIVRPPELGTHVTVIDCFLRSTPGTSEGLPSLDGVVELDRIIDRLRKESGSVGLIRDLEAQRGREWDRARIASFVYRLIEVPLGPSIPEDSGTAALIARFKSDAGPLGQAPDEATLKYQTAQACGQCHKEQFDHWSKSRHAHAYETLVGDRSEKIRECVSCHVTGFMAPGGPKTLESAAPFRGVQCMACHLPPPQGRHPEDYRFPKVTAALCLECHTRANSPKFNYETYLPKGSCCPPKSGAGPGGGSKH